MWAWLRRLLRLGPTSAEINEAMRAFARTYHASPPDQPVACIVPSGMDLRAFVNEALRRYPDLASTQ